jgi:hypothetical protein
MQQRRNANDVMSSGSTWAIVLAIAAIIVGAGIYSIRVIQYGFSAR